MTQNLIILIQYLTNWHSFSCIYPVIDHEFHYHISVKVAVDQQGDSRVDQQTTLKNMTML